jgi:hypothetical protein
MDDKVRVRASIRFLATAEGGRASPLAGGGSYRPNHNFFGPDERIWPFIAFEPHAPMSKPDD